eukprot:scaffold662_cov364-Pavlova_lutheri.AAC.46
MALNTRITGRRLLSYEIFSSFWHWKAYAAHKHGRCHGAPLMVILPCRAFNDANISSILKRGIPKPWVYMGE